MNKICGLFPTQNFDSNIFYKNCAPLFIYIIKLHVCTEVIVNPELILSSNFGWLRIR